ncbi:MAG: type II secretion system ATPase GspE [Candidatus Accumulibacter sp.]|jgi:general secretion pathway protein E|uniref:type II secretion system ATPase GspE n=1 Tax=Accumulibacter sp. TaxID=2053492 RepID=UPI001ACC3B13|nr:type II secretion system ATPase GspE [Accumulibacter sp.]MBN8439823.1 type II secretion system ATPase GspE [Accumulibacter sp.]
MSQSSIPYHFARRHGVMLSTAGEPVLLLRDNASLAALAEVRRRIGAPAAVEVLTGAAFEARLAENYAHPEDNAADVVADVGQEVDISRLMTELPAVEDLLESQDDAPIIRMINALLTQAVGQAASDIHIEPYERDSVVRFRRDGVLVDVARPHRALHAAMVSRIKIMASLDIAEKRLPQDGRIALRLAGRQVDVRVSSLPASHGERMVMRLLDKGSGLRDLPGLGMGADTEATFAGLLQQPHGILLVTGPTGSGKSTTLYAALQQMDAGSRNIVTVEDPVEYDLPGVGQIQVNARIDLTFARALRAILRQDPDVIMIGEIRDLETAQIAVQASLTGHLVLATLHTNDAVAAVTRLMDMGIEPFLLASTLRGVLAQRLVRKLCSACRTPVRVASRPAGGDVPEQMWAAVGCPKCSHSGYAGRTGIYELMTVDAAIAQLIRDSGDEARIREQALANGTRGLRDDGMRLVAAGITSPEELLRVTRD